MEGFDSTRDVASQLIVAAILVGVFALLAADRVHRVLVPLGAVALVWLISYFTPWRLISFEASSRAVDLNVILLLFAMMALVGVLKTTNVFPWMVDRLLVRSQGLPNRALSFVIWFTGIVSALLDNVTTVIFTYPMAASMARRLKINSSAFLLPMVMAANIGGTATLIGDPPNVLIGADPRTGLSFLDFIRRYRTGRRRRPSGGGQPGGHPPAERAAAADHVLDHDRDLRRLHDPSPDAHAGGRACGHRDRRHPAGA